MNDKIEVQHDESTIHANVLDNNQNAIYNGLSVDQIDKLIHDPKQWWNWRFVWQFVVVSGTWILYGFDVNFFGSMLGMPYWIEKVQGPVDGVLAFTVRIGSISASFVSPFMQKRYGRKKTIMFAFGLNCLPASFLQLFAPNLGALAFGRLWNFFGIILAEQTVPLYIAEMVPAKYRSTAVTFSFAANTVVGVFTTVIMYFCSKIDGDNQWKIPLAIQAGLPAVLFVLSFTMLESSSWLLSKGKIEEAIATQSKIRRANQTDLVNAEIAAMMVSFDSELSRTGHRVVDIFKGTNLKRTIGASLAGCLAASSGIRWLAILLKSRPKLPLANISLATTYGVVLLIQVGVADPFRWQIIASVMVMVGIALGGILYDRFGRRPMFVGGLAVVAILDWVNGGYAFTGLTTYNQGITMAALGVVTSFVASVTFSGTYVFVSEIPNIALREYTIAYCIFVNNASSLLSFFVAPYLISPTAANMGPKAYLVYAAFTTVGVIAVFFLIPETKNRTWVEIDEMYEKHIPVWQMRDFKSSRIKDIVDVTAVKQKGDEGNVDV